MKKKNKTIITILVIIAFIFIANKAGFLGALLPVGEYNAYPNEETCTFTTNVDLTNAGYTEYENTAAWIMIDTNGDGVKEKFGYRAHGSSQGGVYPGCGRFSQNEIILEMDAVNIGYYPSRPNDLVICTIPSSTSAEIFGRNYGAASNAVDCQQQVCECTSGACCDGCDYFPYNSQPTGYQDDYFCGGVNGDRVYLKDYFCSGGNVAQSDIFQETCSGTCSNGECIAQNCNTDADTDCNGQVSWTEVNVAVNKWLSGTYSWTQINNIINAWLN